MKTSHFLSNYDFSGRPLIQGVTSSGTIHHQPVHDRNHLFQSVDNCDNDVTITSTYTSTVNSGDNHQQSDYNHSTSSNHPSSTILYGESDTNEYNVIRSTNNKYQHKETAKRKRETGNSNFCVSCYIFVFFFLPKTKS